MSSTVFVKLVLMGQIALVPNAGDQSMTIVMPDARAHDHYPVLTWDSSQVAGAPGACSPLENLDTGGNRGIGNCELTGVRLVFENLATDARMDPFPEQNLGTRRPSRAPVLPGDALQARGVDWIVRAGALDPKLAIDSKFVDGSHSKIAGWTRLEKLDYEISVLSLGDEGGKLGTIGFHPSLPPTPGGPAVRHPAADAVQIVLRLADPSKPLRIVATRVQDGRQAFELNLQPNAWTGVVDLLLGNLPAPPCGATPVPSAAHFRHYDDLLAPRSARLPLPIVEGTSPGKGLDTDFSLFPPASRVDIDANCPSGIQKIIGTPKRPYCLLLAF